MKTKMGCFFLFVLALGCRDSYSDPCPDDYSVVTAIMITSDCVDEDGASVIPARDTTNSNHYTLHAYAYNARGMILIRDVEWRISDASLIESSPIEASPEVRREAITLLRTTADIFDRGGEDEPETTIMACFRNECLNSGEGCVECLPEICSAPHIVRSVINAEGSWEIEGATFPFAVELAASQTGRTLEAISSYYNPRINGRRIEFSSGEYRYVGEFVDREHVVGEAIRSATGEVLGEWTATKCPLFGCAGP